MSDVALIFLM